MEREKERREGGKGLNDDYLQESCKLKNTGVL